jgi:hypothetical protein
MQVIEVKPLDTSSAEIALKDSELILSNAKELVIKNQQEYETAATLGKIIRAKIKELDAMRKKITIPLDSARSAVMQLFKRPLDALEMAQEYTDKGLITYTDEQERIRREQEGKLQREADRKRAELEAKANAAREAGKEGKAEQYLEKANNVVAPVLAPRVEKVQGVAYRELWHAEVVDFAALPDAYKLPNMTMLNKHAANVKGQISIPGVKFFSERIVSQKSA